LWTKVATDATSKLQITKDVEIKVVTSSLHAKSSQVQTKCFQKHHISSQTPQNCMTSSEIETGKCCLPKTLVLHGYAAKTIVNKCGKSTKTK